jgi:hypothetical protein
MFEWTVPSICNSQSRALIVARLLNGSTSIDQSNSNFTITDFGPTIDPSRIRFTTNMTRIAFFTSQPPTGNLVRFMQGVTVEISDATGTQFFQPNKIKFRADGGKIVTKGNFNGQPLSAFFPDQAVRTVRITNPPCGISLLRIMRQGNSFVIVNTAETTSLPARQVIWP